jgi:YHS domain-containing protein
MLRWFVARFLIWGILFFLVSRAFRQFFAAVRQGASSPPPPPPRKPAGPPPGKGEMMVRDPVCGTFVLPSRASSYRDRAGTHHFCSDTCLRAYQSR